MADKAESSRFVIVDGVQIARTRALRLGLIKGDSDKRTDPNEGPSQGNARTSKSARRAGAGGLTGTAPAEATAPAGTEGD